jgi:hypothetical protein
VNGSAQNESNTPRTLAIYNRLLKQAAAELEEATRRWEKLQDDIIMAKMMEFAASCDDSILLAEEKALLEEMNQKLSEAQNIVDFWRNRLEKLRKYSSKLSLFAPRLEADVELHQLRLNVSRRI